MLFKRYSGEYTSAAVFGSESDYGQNASARQKNGLSGGCIFRGGHGRSEVKLRFAAYGTEPVHLPPRYPVEQAPESAGLLRAGRDAPSAGDTLRLVGMPGIGCGDGLHGTLSGTKSAPLAMTVCGRVNRNRPERLVWPVALQRQPNVGDRLQAGEFLPNLRQEIRHLFPILAVGASGRDVAEDTVLGDTGRSGDGDETVGPNHIVKLQQGVVVVAVAVDADDDGRCSLALNGIQPRNSFLRHASAVDRHADHEQVRTREPDRPLRTAGRDVDFATVTAQALRHFDDDLFRRTRGTEIYRIDFRNFHNIIEAEDFSVF